MFDTSSLPTMRELGLVSNTRKSIQSYVSKHKTEWDKELKTDQKISKFIRPQESQLPYSIEYWNDKTYLVHTNICHATGGNKKIMYSVDIKKEIVYARDKPLKKSGKKKLVQEARKIDSFKGSRGLIQNTRSSSYLSKDKNEEKFHMIQELYSGTFDSLILRKLSDKELKIVALDLIHGLAAIHGKGLLHNDLKGANILFQLKKNTVIKSLFCDLGETSDGSDSATKISLKKEQSKEVILLLGMIQSLYRSQGKPCPKVIEDMVAIPNMEGVRRLGLKPAGLSAEEALLNLESYYKKH